MPSLDDLVADFFDAMTGGNFQVVARAPDLVRALQVQNIAAGLNGALRNALGVHIQGISSQMSILLSKFRELKRRLG